MRRTINNIVIHCTATPQTTTVQSIQNHWQNVLKWRNPGYHLLIERDGKINELATFDVVTNGVAGNNANSIHISYIGGVDANNRPIDNRTQAQKEAILKCIAKALRYAPNARILGHRDFPRVAKACPSFDAIKEYQFI
jgi:N-acetylmuramoyl-L-alanine amidase